MFKSSGRALGFFVAFFALSVASAQTDKSLPGCEPPRNLRIAMREELDPNKFEGMKTYERMARRVQIIQALMEKFPREVYPAHDLIWYAWYGDLDLLPALQHSFATRERANPDDPVAIYWSGYSYFWDDAPEAIRKFKRARDLALPAKEGRSRAIPTRRDHAAAQQKPGEQRASDRWRWRSENS